MSAQNSLKKHLTRYSIFWNTASELLPSYVCINIARFNIQDYKSKTGLDKYYLTNHQSSSMLLDVLFYLQEFTPDLTFRRSCREGICGSCSMSVNGTNTLACLYNVKTNIKNNFISKSIVKYNSILVTPLPHMPVIKDLVVSFNHFYKQYNSIDPYRKTVNDYKNQSAYLIKKKDRALLDGIYECILCACCSTSCPSYWWNSKTYLGPAVLLQAYRWIVDPNDSYTSERLGYLDDKDKLYKCHTIMNCSLTCPKSLRPAESIMKIKNYIHLLNKSSYQKETSTDKVISLDI